MDIYTFSDEMAFSPVFNGDKLSHAYIISGPAGSGKTALADTLAAAILCSGDGKRPCGVCRHCRKTLRHIHPDISVIDKPKDSRAILVDQIRAVRSDSIVVPNEAEKKVYIIKNAGTMNVSAQNAMLKLLEEPPRHAAFILIAENPSELLPTVRSRCVSYALTPSASHLSKEMQDEIYEFFSSLEQDDIALTGFSFKLDALNSQELDEFISGAREMAVSRLRNLYSGKKEILTAEYLMRVINTLDSALEYTEFNVSSGHIAGMLCAELLQRNEEQN